MAGPPPTTSSPKIVGVWIDAEVLTIDANIWVSAFDPRDGFHGPSTAFLRAVSKADTPLHGPIYLAVEVACAIARRTVVERAGVLASQRLRAHPTLTLHPMDPPLLAAAQELGVRHRLRAGDALYAATALLTSAPLVSWDRELVERSGARTPEDWLAEEAGTA